MKTSKQYTMLKHIESYPVLSITEEKLLTEEYFKTKNKTLMHKIVYGNWRFAAKAAHSFSAKNNLDFLECFQEAIVGMIIALDKFDPNKSYNFPKARFTSYAQFQIMVMMQKYLYNNHSIVVRHGTSSRKRLHGRVDAEELERLNELDGYRSGTLRPPGDFSLNNSTGLGGETFYEEFQDLLEADTESVDEQYFKLEEQRNKRNLVKKTMQQLDVKDRKILRKRYMLDETMTLQEIANDMDISRERVRQREERSIKKFKKIYKNQGYLVK